MLKCYLKVFIKILVLVTLVFTTNCSVNKSNIVDRTPEAEDPWENLNRGTFAFNQTFDKYLLAPLAKGYRLVFPAEIRTGVRNFLSNLSEPWSSINSALQGDLKNTGNTLARFVINSRFGLLALFDVLISKTIISSTSFSLNILTALIGSPTYL